MRVLLNQVLGVLCDYGIVGIEVEIGATMMKHVPSHQDAEDDSSCGKRATDGRWVNGFGGFLKRHSNKKVSLLILSLRLKPQVKTLLLHREHIV